MESADSDRPVKRVRQACEPCSCRYNTEAYQARRKKAKCPGEQPICSLCARLHQNCYYSEERRRRLASDDDNRSPLPTLPTLPDALDSRLQSLEGKIETVLDRLGYC
ncbi:hypothetical protein N7468_009957 [Penicillium chermesinum]|uniref:Zn(2)-C6 fungal-type domain-containing protein n=1 Tax=Penicillium chermesinum TaxID=63820 RepID=A0A9W9TC26_9EURO|nr:uncharacterized protein N7468_009957 [Penicillium chermesinum]KAJ5216949.1 hypothetical protein N7468_009957 [Penicillium chermesinum]